jgi:hypothetical protein
MKGGAISKPTSLSLESESLGLREIQKLQLLKYRYPF